ncbi:MAG: 30S ribosomal protein S9 [Chloroflexi bacterium]|nr:30S ribosomal protein S9 [Chloroflexota bacterium]
MTEERYFYAIGKRKCAVAKVRLFPGSGTLIVNGKPLEEVLPLRTLQETVQEPFRVAQLTNNYNASIRVSGGGIAGQAQAIRHGIARALVVANEELRPVMRKAGLLTRDSRVKERKKYGLKRARKAPQYTKR